MQPTLTQGQVAKYGLVSTIIGIVLFIIAVVVWVKNKNVVNMVEDPTTFTSPRKREALYSETTSARDWAFWVWFVPVALAIVGFFAAMVANKKTVPAYSVPGGPPQRGMPADEF